MEVATAWNDPSSSGPQQWRSIPLDDYWPSVLRFSVRGVINFARRPASCWCGRQRNSRRPLFFVSCRRPPFCSDPRHGMKIAILDFLVPHHPPPRATITSLHPPSPTLFSIHETKRTFTKPTRKEKASRNVSETKNGNYNRLVVMQRIRMVKRETRIDSVVTGSFSIVISWFWFLFRSSLVFFYWWGEDFIDRLFRLM